MLHITCIYIYVAAVEKKKGRHRRSMEDTRIGIEEGRRKMMARLKRIIQRMDGNLSGADAVVKTKRIESGGQFMRRERVAVRAPRISLEDLSSEMAEDNYVAEDIGHHTEEENLRRRSTRKNAGRWCIDSLIVGDGGCEYIEAGTLYASTLKDPVPTDQDTIWAIPFALKDDLEMFRGYSRNGVTFPTKWLKRDGVPVRSDPVPTLCIPPIYAPLTDSQRAHVIFCEVESFLMDPEHQGIVVVIDQIRARSAAINLISQYNLALGPTFATKISYNCAESALLNGIACLRGEDIALTVAWNMQLLAEEMVINKLSGMSTFLKGLDFHEHRCELRVDKDFESWLEAGMCMHDWLEFRKTGVYMVRLYEDGKVNHAVCVDARPGKRVIWDCEEAFPVKLTSSNLKKCAGAGSNALVKEVRELVHVE